jgi:UDP-N-acetylmuramoyl-tripeptide--D-alanyl-D-alanine ligase
MVKRLRLSDLIEGISGWHPSGLEMPVCPTVDSRKAEPGAVFFAFEGERVDGHDYVPDAFERGAIAAVVQRDVSLDATEVSVVDLTTDVRPSMLKTPLVIRVSDVLKAMQDAATFWRLQHNPRVVGVTGSVGKTTTKELIARVLSQRYRALRSVGSYNNEIGLPLTLLQLTDEHERLVLEMGMYVRGDIRFLAEMARPHIGVITNVEPVHAERAGSLANIALAKQELVEALPPAPEGVAILNYDDLRVRQMADHTQARVFFYGLSSRLDGELPDDDSPDDGPQDLWADEVTSLGLDGLRLRIHYGKERLYLRVPLLGRHSAHTVLRATAVGLVEGLTWQEILEGLRSPSAQLRLVAVSGPRGSRILDDTYNASPPSSLAALNLLDDLGGRKIAVLGDMLELGPYEEEGHRKVGCRAAGVLDVLVTVGPRARWIAQEAIACGLDRAYVQSVDTSEAAIALLQEIVQEDDVILVKGSRALKMETIVAALGKPGDLSRNAS